MEICLKTDMTTNILKMLIVFHAQTKNCVSSRTWHLSKITQPDPILLFCGNINKCKFAEEKKEPAYVNRIE